MTVYISGPISGKYQGNRWMFLMTSLKFEATGIKVCNPHRICKHLPPNSPWIDYMAICLGALPKCDCIYMLPGWIWSRGARIEWIVSKLLGIKRFR